MRNMVQRMHTAGGGRVREGWEEGADVQVPAPERGVAGRTTHIGGYCTGRPPLGVVTMWRGGRLGTTAASTLGRAHRWWGWCGARLGRPIDCASPTAFLGLLIAWGWWGPVDGHQTGPGAKRSVGTEELHGGRGCDRQGRARSRPGQAPGDTPTRTAHDSRSAATSGCPRGQTNHGRLGVFFMGGDAAHHVRRTSFGGI